MPRYALEEAGRQTPSTRRSSWARAYSATRSLKRMLSSSTWRGRTRVPRRVGGARPRGHQRGADPEAPVGGVGAARGVRGQEPERARLVRTDQLGAGWDEAA